MGTPGPIGDPDLEHDCRNGQDWRRLATGRALFEAWSPKPDSPWAPYAKPTLFACLPAKPWDPARAPTMDWSSPTSGLDVRPHRPARLPNESLLHAPFRLPPRTGAIVDLRAGMGVAYAGWLVRSAGLEPVPLYNNWPHAKGVVPAGQTLGALLYYAPWALEAQREPGPAVRPPCFLLDRNRLGRKLPEVNDFDNRYFHTEADFPSGATLRRNGVDRLVYIRPEEDVVDPVPAPQGEGVAGALALMSHQTVNEGPDELDDLNATLRELRKTVGIDIARAGSDAWTLTPPQEYAPAERKTPFSTTTDPAFAGFRRAGAGGFGRIIPDRQGGGYG